jgi:steroid delta-isomerase-like uncharacterized protein
MTNKHDTTLRKLIEDVWNNGKYNEADQLVSPDFVSHDPMTPTKGAEAFKNAVKKYRTAFPDLNQRVDEIITSGDTVVARLTCTGTHRGPLDAMPPTGRAAKVSAIIIAHFSGDRVKEAYVNWDALGLLQQLGVVTLPGRTSAASA